MAEQQNPVEKTAQALDGVLTTGLDSAERGIDVLLETVRAAKTVGLGTVQAGVNVADKTLDAAIDELEALKAKVRAATQRVADTLTGQG